MAKNRDDVIGALEEVKAQEDGLGLWAHDNEHSLRHRDLGRAVKWFDRAVSESRERRRPILDRILQLGGTLDTIVADPLDALAEYCDRLKALHRACAEAYDPADDADDYVTIKLLAENQTALERRMEKLDAMIAWARSFKSSDQWTRYLKG